MQRLFILSGGAAKGLVNACAGDPSGNSRDVQGQFGAVGLMCDKLLAGELCDVLILSRPLIDQLAAKGIVDANTTRSLGYVDTGIAIRAGERLPQIDTPESLRATLRGATEIYFPDPAKATAGIHFAKVLDQLGIAKGLSDRMRPYPHGAAAMAAMVTEGAAGAIGCTQVTEILYTPGVTLVGVLPEKFALRTEYVAAVPQSSLRHADAVNFIATLSGTGKADDRRQAGFET